MRDTLATLKYEIWESEAQIQRKHIRGNEWDKYIEKRFSEWPNFNMDCIDGLVYKPKNVIEAKEAFAFMEDIVPNKNNIFLFSKKL